ncbi:MAG: WD40 repeat domain-containing protein, partial [Caldilineaceae bacterium]|nr:WD40 repeat domain-containing protein [Caldilineaceae bacterium]
EAKEVQILQGPTARLSDMVLSADGNIIIAVTPNWIEDREFHKLWLWDIRNSEELSVLRDIGKSGQADVRGADTLAISPDGTLLALNACAGRVDLGLGGLICEFAGVQLFNTSSGQLEVDMSHAFVNGVWAIAFSPDGKLIAASGKNGTAKLFSAPSGKEKFTVLEADHHTIDVAFTPDSKTLAVALGDGTIHLFNTETGDESNVLEGHAEAVTSIAFSPDGALLASGSTDSTVGIWDVSTGQRLATLEGHEDAVLSVAFSPAGTYLASGGNDKAFRLWGLPR